MSRIFKNSQYSPQYCFLKGNLLNSIFMPTFTFNLSTTIFETNIVSYRSYNLIHVTRDVDKMLYDRGETVIV